MKKRNLRNISEALNENGFTMIEVLIAIIILTSALLGGAALTVGIMKGNKHSDYVTTAAMLTQEKLEDIQNLGYAGTPAADNTAIENYNTIDGYPLYKRITVTDVDNPGDNMKTISVTVYWDSDNKSLDMKTIIANEG